LSHIVTARSESFPPFRPTSGELVRRCAERWGDAPFVTLGDDRMSYAEAEARSTALASWRERDLSSIRSGAATLGERFGLVEDRGASPRRGDA
jgi:hypothetical protein